MGSDSFSCSFGEITNEYSKNRQFEAIITISEGSSRSIEELKQTIANTIQATLNKDSKIYPEYYEREDNQGNIIINGSIKTSESTEHTPKDIQNKIAA